MTDCGYIHSIQTSAPGRICLFGEHQDYLGLPVIASAIDLRVSLSAMRSDLPGMRLELPDIGDSLAFDPNKKNDYRSGRDYILAAASVLRREGLSWPCGWDITVSGNIPINSGSSSSSALQIAWCSFLLAAAMDRRATDPVAVARVAHLSEVVEFESPGGTMDHYSCACGGTIWLDCGQEGALEQLPPCPGEFVLVDSKIPKDTNGALGNIRRMAEEIEVDYRSLAACEVQEYASILERLPLKLKGILEANRENARLTAIARQDIEQKCGPTRIAELLNQHHGQLSKNLGVSLPEIDVLIDFGLSKGALGGKINGSGQGGSFYLLCNGNGAEIRQEYQKLGFPAYLVKVGQGLECRINTTHSSREFGGS